MLWCGKACSIFFNGQFRQGTVKKAHTYNGPNVPILRIFWGSRIFVPPFILETDSGGFPKIGLFSPKSSCNFMGFSKIKHPAMAAMGVTGHQNFELLVPTLQTGEVRQPEAPVEFRGLGLMSQLLGIGFTSPKPISVGNDIPNSWVMLNWDIYHHLPTPVEGSVKSAKDCGLAGLVLWKSHISWSWLRNHYSYYMLWPRIPNGGFLK